MQQWVWEICFPTGDYENNNGNDMKFMDDLLCRIEESGIAAHSPIEQRWTASSSSLMSPAHGLGNELHSWVGIIMYLPSDDEMQRRDITDRFTGQYCDLFRNIGAHVNATSHWAKLERPNSVWQLLDLQLFLNERYPLSKFNEARSILDPNNILASPNMSLILGQAKKNKLGDDTVREQTLAGLL
jgi:L-galactono-1,4-lactone dehydrogenase